VLDGFPRTIAQAQALDRMLDKSGRKIDAVVSLEVPPEVLIERQTGRRSCPKCGTIYHLTQNPPAVTGVCDKDGAALVQLDGAKPAFKGYLSPPFPACLCASINEEVVHGIPSKKRVLKEGDIIKLDFGVVYRGYYGDSARSVPVGKVSDEAKALMEATRESLF